LRISAFVLPTNLKMHSILQRYIAPQLSRLFLLLPIAQTILVLSAGINCSADGLKLQLISPSLIGERLEDGHVPAKERQLRIEQLFREVGCETALQPVDKKSANVICDLPGEMPDPIVVGAHFDFVDEGQGIVDDWSGASLLVSLYQTLKTSVRKHSYEFVAFAGEERGLKGSIQYVKEISARQKRVPDAFVNLECLGVAAPKVWVTRSNPALVQRLTVIAKAMHISLEGVNVDNLGDDDTHPFYNQHIPVISIHSLMPDNWRILHSSRDNSKVINMANYYDAYRLVAFYLEYLDAWSSPQPSPLAAVDPHSAHE
jgi:hypothetical protein